MNKIKCILVSGVLSISMLSCNLLSVYACTDKGSSYASSNGICLGNAGDFAAFANNLEIYCDLEGNIAANKVNFCGGDAGVSSNVEGHKTSYIENFANTSNCSEFLKRNQGTDTLIIGDKYQVNKDTRDSRWKISDSGRECYYSPINNIDNVVNIKDSEYKIDFNKEFSELTELANQLTTMETNTTNINYSDRNGSIVCKSEINVLNLSMDEYYKLNDFNIELQGNATLIINLENYNGQALDNKITINGSRDTYKGNAGQLLWNFGSYDKQVQLNETSQGCVLAPKAEVNVNTTHNGNIIANTIKNCGGEIHKNDFTGQLPTCNKDNTSNESTSNNDVTEYVPTKTPEATITPVVTETPDKADTSVTPNEPVATEVPEVTDEPVVEANTPNTPDSTDTPAVNLDSPDEPTVTSTPQLVPENETPLSSTADNDNPKTADTANIIIIILAAATSLGTVVFILIKKGAIKGLN